MNKRQTWFVGAALIGLVAVGLDRVFVLPGPATASAAAAIESVSASLDLSSLEARASSMLLRASGGHGHALLASVEGEANAFDPAGLRMVIEESLKAASDDAADAEVSLPVVRASRAARLPVLSAVVASGAREGIAVLDGRALSVGQTRDGITLVSVTARTATVRIDGVEHVLSLPLPAQTHGSDQ